MSNDSPVLRCTRLRRGRRAPGTPSRADRRMHCVRTPLLEVLLPVPLLRIDQHVESMLQAERIALVDRSWLLADDCARLASQGRDRDPAGYDLRRAPAPHRRVRRVRRRHRPASEVTWRTITPGRAAWTSWAIPLPMGLRNPCQLAVRVYGTSSDLDLLLALRHLDPRAPAESIGQRGREQPARHEEVRRQMRRLVGSPERRRRRVSATGPQPTSRHHPAGRGHERRTRGTRLAAARRTPWTGSTMYASRNSTVG